MISATSVLPELQPFHHWISQASEVFRKQAEQNLRDLDSGEDDILPDILSETQNLWLTLQIFNSRLVSHLLRARSSDQLCLRLVQWLHSSHRETQHIPVCLNDGDFSSLPSIFFPVVYFIPPSAQQRLLYLPLLFHEYGHVLYACHKPEMDALVKDLQGTIRELLEPRSQRDDKRAEYDEQNRRLIVEAWYEWTQELFCDAVGFMIGGPAFARAFSMFLCLSGRDAFNLPFEELLQRTHPVTWLRIRFIAAQARKAGHVAVAKDLEDTWQQVAEMMSVEEDYPGFYEKNWLPEIQRTIDDMLTEADPVTFSDEEISIDSLDGNGVKLCDYFSPVQLLNQAWRMFLKNPNTYTDWEEVAVEAMLKTAPNMALSR